MLCVMYRASQVRRRLVFILVQRLPFVYVRRLYDKYYTNWTDRDIDHRYDVSTVIMSCARAVSDYKTMGQNGCGKHAALNTVSRWVG